jgi:hypothetical protein
MPPHSVESRRILAAQWTPAIILPPLRAAGFDPIWFGVAMTIVMEMGLIHPPVGLNLFVIKNVAPDIPLRDVVIGVLPFVRPDAGRRPAALLRAGNRDRTAGAGLRRELTRRQNGAARGFLQFQPFGGFLIFLGERDELMPGVAGRRAIGEAQAESGLFAELAGTHCHPPLCHAINLP